eukprot:jgi/Astpho2/711/e_gw1.00015.21.1_t
MNVPTTTSIPGTLAVPRCVRSQHLHHLRAVAHDQPSVWSWQSNDVVQRVHGSSAIPLVLCPGFGNCSTDYVSPFGAEGAGIVAALEARGFRVFVPDLQRKEWFAVARSLLSWDTWRGRSTVEQGYRWYLEKLQATVDQARRECKAEQVDLLGHSAGGWLARSFLGDPLYIAQLQQVAAGTDTDTIPSLTSLSNGREPSSNGTAPDGSSPSQQQIDQQRNHVVRRVVTMGTPHLLTGGARDFTGGALTWVNKQWPGSFFAGDGLEYVCLAGRVVRADKNAPRKSLARYAYGSYSQTCRDAQGKEGDGVVALCCAHLPGANNITLDGCFHSISKTGTFEEASELVWYGSPQVIDSWAHALL